MRTIAVFLLLAVASTKSPATDVTVQLNEWSIKLDKPSIPSGSVRFIVHNAGSIPHGVEVEGHGIERRIALIQPGATDTLALTLKTGRYEMYCPVGSGSHKKLGMETSLSVGVAPATDKPASQLSRRIHVTGGGPVIQILPGPFPFPDSVASTLPLFGDERTALESQITSGPYSNNVKRIDGRFSLTAIDLGATHDSVSGTATFTTSDGAHWRAVLDRVQTHDTPHHPRFGGVILGLYYHGNTGVHTPLVPTINSAVALWSIAHLYRNDSLVTDNAMVHVMLLSHTRSPTTFALQCWDCSKRTVDELQLQITPAAGEAKFNSPGGFLFVNWERSTGNKFTP